YKYYKVALGRLPFYHEITLDLVRVTGQTGEERVIKQNAFADAWVNRAEHKEQNPDSLSNREFVDKLEQRTSVALASKDQIIAELNGSKKTRAQVLRALVESPAGLTKVVE
ncbi:MAG: hypothetical protein WKF30_05815, partial [Pyrinomonadaceae bacterium]